MAQLPVVFVVFNRPEHTEQTFAAIRRQRPPVLFVVADGPRSEVASDAERCAKVRKIVGRVDWPCEVHRNYSDVNLGLKKRISSGLDWVFRKVESAAILEDDCLAHPDFFRFCEVLLMRYRGDERVAVVTGNNFQAGRWRGQAAYYFSKYNHCWGWATWRRAWCKYQGNLCFWPAFRDSSRWRELASSADERAYWNEIFDRVYAGDIESWAYPWTASVWFHGGLTATPNVNLVSNIGFGVDSTHTTSTGSPLSAVPTRDIGRITHPASIAADTLADQYTFATVYAGRRYRRSRAAIRFLRLAMNRLRGMRRPG